MANPNLAEIRELRLLNGIWRVMIHKVIITRESTELAESLTLIT